MGSIGSEYSAKNGAQMQRRNFSRFQYQNDKAEALSPRQI